MACHPECQDRIDTAEAEITTYKLIAEMLGEGDFDFFYSGNNEDNEEHWPLCINVNDTFCFAADCERIPWEKIPEVYKLWRETQAKWRHLLEERDSLPEGIEHHTPKVVLQKWYYKEISEALARWVAKQRGIDYDTSIIRKG
jgi:hypothetical protein